jgi:hypothetical protein
MACFLRTTVRGLAGAALIAAAIPQAAVAKGAARAPRSHEHRLAASHGMSASHDWLTAEHVYAEIGRRGRALDGSAKTRIARTVLSDAAHVGLDPLVVLAIIHVESSFNPAAVSPVGAVGLMQLLEPTMREVATRSGLASADPRDPVANVQAGIRYFATLVRSFSDVELALMAYNAGPNRIRRYLRAGEIPERFWTYPRKVKRELERLRAERKGALARKEAELAPAPASPAPGPRLAAAHAQPPRSGTARPASSHERSRADAATGTPRREARAEHGARGLPVSSARLFARGARVRAAARCGHGHSPPRRRRTSLARREEREPLASA